jgi:hypothetical protein
MGLLAFGTEVCSALQTLNIQLIFQHIILFNAGFKYELTETMLWSTNVFLLLRDSIAHFS